MTDPEPPVLRSGRIQFHGVRPQEQSGLPKSVATLIRRLDNAPTPDLSTDVIIRAHRVRALGEIALAGKVTHYPPWARFAVCNSENTAARVRRANPQVEVFVLHSMVDDFSLPEWSGRRDGIGYTPDPTRWHKGGDFIVKLQNQLPGHRFVYSNKTPLDLMPEFYAQLSLLLVPSRIEPYPRVVMEAASAGVPVLASDLPGIRETECAAAYLPLDDTRAWSAAIEEYDTGEQHLRDEARARYDANRERQDRDLAAFLEWLPQVQSRM